MGTSQGPHKLGGMEVKHRGAEWGALDLSRYAGRRMVRMELLGRRSRERPKTKYMGVVREDVIVGVREHDAAAVIPLCCLHNHSNSLEGIFINEPTGGIRCLPSFRCISLKLGEDSLPLQTGSAWVSSRRTKCLDYPNDILLCCWLWYPNLAVGSERLLAYPAAVQQWRKPGTTHQLQTCPGITYLCNRRSNITAVKQSGKNYDLVIPEHS